MSDDDVLYKVGIKTPASPQEVADFCDLLEAHGYEVVTDMKNGLLRIQEVAGDE